MSIDIFTTHLNFELCTSKFKKNISAKWFTIENKKGVSHLKTECVLTPHFLSIKKNRKNFKYGLKVGI